MANAGAVTASPGERPKLGPMNNRWAQLTIGTGGPGGLRYDSNGDGSFAGTVAPTAAASGGVVDADPPVIGFSANRSGPQVVVTISASDAGSGVARVLRETAARPAR